MTHFGPWEEDGRRLFITDKRRIECPGEGDSVSVIFGGWQDREGNVTRHAVIGGGCLDGSAVAELIAVLEQLTP
ncbi:MAG: hypothetical protein EKK34_18145 [Mycobacterium sp.]|nr:MAG: hypothetical protein EKK34_18145 [Mycobacterium sp.]